MYVNSGVVGLDSKPKSPAATECDIMVLGLLLHPDQLDQKHDLPVTLVLLEHD